MVRDALGRLIEVAERDVFEFGGERWDRVVELVLARLLAPVSP